MVFIGCDPWYFSNDDVQYMYTEVSVYEEPTEGGGSVVSRGGGWTKKLAEGYGYKIYHIAQILPVDVQGMGVQANDIIIEGNYAYVAYNRAGDDFAGALQIINIKNRRFPVLVAEIGFPTNDYVEDIPGLDVNALLVDGDTLYFAGQADPDADSTPLGSLATPGNNAFVGTASIAAMLAGTDPGFRFAVLPSYAATGIALHDGLFAATGAHNGELKLLDEVSLVDHADDAGIADYEDLRDVDEYEDGVIVLAGTDSVGPQSTGMVLIYDRDSLGSPNVIPVDDFLSAEAKATIDVYSKRYAFLGLSDAGFKVVDLTEDVTPGVIDYRFEADNPTAPWTTKTPTNSVSFSGNLIFTANGEYGFRVMRLLNLDGKQQTFGYVVGFVPFDEFQDSEGNYWSANHVEYKKNTLFVASGTGGVNVYRIESQ